MRINCIQAITCIAVFTTLAACGTAPKKPSAEAKKITPGIHVSLNALNKSVVLPPSRITVDRNEHVGTAIDWEAGRAKVVTTYVYMLGHLGKDVLTEAKALEILDEQFRDEMKMAVENGMYKKIGELDKAATSFSVPVPSGERVGLRRLMHMEGVNGNFPSLTYLFYREPFAVKYRISFPPDEDPAFADKFVRDTYLRLHVTWPEMCRDWRKTSEENRTVYVNKDLDVEAQAKQAAEGIVRVTVLSAKVGCEDLELARLLESRFLESQKATDD